MFPASVQSAAADVMVTMFDAESMQDSLRLAGELRAAGLRVEVYPEADKLGKQFKYCASRTIRFVTVLGGDERAASTVTVKDMKSGEQTVVPRERVAAWFADALGLTPVERTDRG
jgi:histidyl-tRNA synthetase